MKFNEMCMYAYEISGNPEMECICNAEKDFAEWLNNLEQKN